MDSPTAHEPASPGTEFDSGHLRPGEIIAHLTGQPEAKVEVRLDIQADIPDGAPDKVVRTVTENCRALDFDSQGFEDE